MSDPHDEDRLIQDLLQSTMLSRQEQTLLHIAIHLKQPVIVYLAQTDMECSRRIGSPRELGEDAGSMVCKLSYIGCSNKLPSLWLFHKKGSIFLLFILLSFVSFRITPSGNHLKLTTLGICFSHGLNDLIQKNETALHVERPFERTALRSGLSGLTVTA